MAFKHRLVQNERTWMSLSETTPEFLVDEVLQRCRFTRAEDVRKLASLANAERQFGREYHGRFVIELLQNAADAWRKIAAPEERSKVRVILDQGPSLTVANQGELLTAETIIKSLGHIGASTKPQGEAIGHKGIGFKSVLEMTLCPEVYSGFSDGQFDVAARFDPERALEQIKSCTREWEDFLAEVTGLPDDPLAPIPVLQFPFPVEHVADGILELGRAGFTTVVRLAFDPAHGERLRLDAAQWEATARTALQDVTDEIVLLLDTFDEVVLEDGLEGDVVRITHSPEEDPRILGDGVRVSQVQIRRNEEISSRWRLYRETLPDTSLLEGDIVTGIPLTVDHEDPPAIATAVASAPFHLFFPTRIASGTPFLLHGYFEVAAGRANFYGGSEERNRSLLARLSQLAARAVDDSAAAGIGLGPLAHLLEQAAPPEDGLAARFQTETIRALDTVMWVPTRAHPDVPRLVTPLQALAFSSSQVTAHLADAFDAGYVWKKAGAAVIHGAVDDAGTAFLAERRARHDPPLPNLWATLRSLCTPGDDSPWPVGSEDQGFVSLLNLIAGLQSTARSSTQELIAELRGNDLARVIPVVAPGDSRNLVAPPAPRPPGGGGVRSQLILARLREREDGELVPPAELQVSFIKDELLDARLLSGAASELGVQEYVVDTILDRLDGLELDEDSSRSVTRFVWRLLVREQRSAFGLRRSLQDLSAFDPARWFWFQPGRADGAEGDRQGREHGLASLLLPSRAGTWMPASRLAFGSDWADWLESEAAGPLTSASRARVAAYRDLEVLAPSQDRLLAPHEQVFDLLPDVPIWDEDWPEELTQDARMSMLRHGFLLRLGVWEVAPIEVFLDRRDRTDDRIPWPGPLRDRLLSWVRVRGGWNFGYASYEHERVTIGEDYRFEWPFDGCDPDALARSIARASRLCERLAHLFAFCPGCRTHRTRYTTDASSAFPSRLALQLKTEPWLPCVKDGQDVDAPLAATKAWWEPLAPDRSNIHQSPLRYLEMVRPGTHLPQELRDLAELPQLSTARIGRISELLTVLRDDYLAADLTPDPRGSKLAKQTFIGLHRAGYDRLSDISLKSPDEVRTVVDETQVLCDLAGTLEYKPVNQARHDDGRFSPYKRYFSTIPFAVIARERDVVARRLGIQPFDVKFVRRDQGAGADVTDEVASLLGDRIVEFLAIVVNHSLGTQTLELGSEQFQERARRLQRLRVIRLDELVLDAEVVGTDIRASIGEHAGFDVFLDGPTTSQPVLYHDFPQESWRERLRGKLGENVAAVLENPAYSATLTLFLQKETDADREDFLLELGVTPDDVDAVRLALGVVSEADRQRRLVWFQAICEVAGGPAHGSEDAQDEEANLVAAGLQVDTARRLVELGGGSDVRANVGPDGTLRLLADAGVSLEALHRALVARGDSGLVIRTGVDALRTWRARYGRYVAAVLETKLSAADAKARVESWSLDPALRFELAPDAIAVIGPVVDDLRGVGLYPDARALVGEDPIAELTRLAGCATVGELEQRVLALFDAEERNRILRGLARDWRQQLRVIGVLVRAVPHEPRAATRLHADEVDRLLPHNPDCPTELRSQLPELLPGVPGLIDSLGALLVDEVTASPPDRKGIGALLEEHGLEPARLAEIEKVLAMPAKTEARVIRSQMDQLTSHSIDVKPPKKRAPQPPKPRRRPHVVRTIHVGGGEPRRRQVGAEGERWALAAVIKPLLDLDVRKQAIPAITGLLRTFEGQAVQRALAHEDAVMAADLDEEDLIDELTGLLHVAKYSDAFGFDLLGWLPPVERATPQAMCLEAKSSADGTFHLSAAEWDTAAAFREDGRGDSYAVLVVRRGSGPAPVPERLDLLVDPVGQCEGGLLSRREDGYVITY